MAYWYLSFADPKLPAGTQWLGASIVEAWSAKDAVGVSHALHCNPGGEVVLALIPGGWGRPPAQSEHRLIKDKNELVGIFKVWSSDPNDRLLTLGEAKAKHISVAHVIAVCPEHNNRETH